MGRKKHQPVQLVDEYDLTNLEPNVDPEKVHSYLHGNTVPEHVEPEATPLTLVGESARGAVPNLHDGQPATRNGAPEHDSRTAASEVGSFMTYPLHSSTSRTLRMAASTLEQFDETFAEIERRNRLGAARVGEPFKKEDTADLCLRLGLAQLRLYLDATKPTGE